MSQNPKVDVLSDILGLVSAQSFLSTGLITGGDWSILTPPHPGLKFNALVQGHAWVIVEGEAPVALGPGDCFILTRGRAFVVASDPDLAPVDAAEAFRSTVNGVARYGERDDVRFVGGRMTIDEADAELLVDPLPPLIRLAAGSPGAGHVQWLLARLVDETGAGRPGAAAAAASLMHLMFIEGIRAGLGDETAARDARGWVAASSDRRIAESLRAIHAEPGRAWTLEDLAAAAGMSRSNFALRFKGVTGVSPLAYLADWRMRIAGRFLRTGSGTVSSIALGLGYGSESAFSNAFKRVRGVSPLLYRRTARGEGGPPRTGEAAKARTIVA